MDVVAVRKGLAARLDLLVGDDGGTSPYWVSNFLPPFLMVSGTPDVDYAAEGRPADDSEIELIVLAFTGIVEETASQDRLDRWKASSGDESVRSILEGRDDDDLFLGLEDVFDVTVLRASENTLHSLPSVPGADVLGCEFTVRVSTSG